MVDPLEPRRLFSASLDRHVLTVLGTASADAISVALKRPGVLRLDDNGHVSTFALRNVHAIRIDGGAGNDHLILNDARGRLNVPATLLGGRGDDELIGTAAPAEWLVGGAGRDSLIGNGGSDVVYGQAGVDIFHACDSAAERMDQAAEDKVIEDGVAWNAINDFTYQLQNVDLTAMGQSKFDLAIIDPFDDNGVARTREQIAALQNSPGGPKRVLAYLSIGEAENYRAYWNAAWDANNDGTPDAGAPDWLAKVNVDWAGNYAVKYWDAAWQAIVLKAVDDLVKQGFDGVYLDLVDAYETWGPDGNNQRPTAERDMVEFVKTIAGRARTTDGKADFAVVPQNGEALGRYADYLATITATGHEDVFFDGDTQQPENVTTPLVKALNIFKNAGKPVWIIDYPRKGKNIDRVYRAAADKGYVAYCPRRDLSQLTINAGHEPD